MPALDAALREKINESRAAGRLRRLPEQPLDGPDFSRNDYLGLSQDTSVIAAGIRAAEQYGAGAGASRLVSGNHPLYAELETRLAEYKQTEAALVFGSGYLANLGVVTALAGEGDLILADQLIHASLIDAMQLSGAAFRRFRHHNVAQCDNLLRGLRGRYRHCLILTESVFSMDGDRAPLAELTAIAKRYQAWLLVDDAHGMGVLTDISKPAGHVITLGTLSKAAGCYGGYVAGSRTLIDYLVTTARPFIYSTGLPPFVIGAAIRALEMIAADAERVALPLRRARLFTELLGLPPAESAIVPLIVGEETAAMAAAEHLRQQGFGVIAIRPPTVPDGTARLRFTFSALHSEDDVRSLATAVQALGLA